MKIEPVPRAVFAVAAAISLAAGTASAQSPYTTYPYSQPPGAHSYSPPTAPNQYGQAPGYPLQPDYEQQPGYQQQPVYPQQQAYPQRQTYPQQQAYPQQHGYPQGQGYPQQQVYPPQGAYPQGQYPSQAASQRPMCFECGTVESMREVEKKGEGTGLGAVAGGLGGLILGKQVGNGKGQNVGALLGAAGGAYAGHQIEKSAHSTKSYEIHVRMEDGSFRTIPSATAPAWRTGERVRIINGQLQSDIR